MWPSPPAALQLASRLKQLRQQWPGLTQEKLRIEAGGESSQEELTVNRSWNFRDGGRVTIFCALLPPDMIGPFGDPGNLNSTELHKYADVGALIELFGHIRAENPAATVHFKASRDVQSDELADHVILLGSVVRNDIIGRLAEMAKLPIRQVKETPLESGEIFVADIQGEERPFWPKWMDESKKVLMEDIGLLARVPNPLNASRTLTICNGIHSRGVYGAVRALTDAQMREGNERYISTNFGDARAFAILMSVKVIQNRAMSPDFHGPDVVLYEWAEDAK